MACQRWSQTAMNVGLLSNTPSGVTVSHVERSPTLAAFCLHLVFSRRQCLAVPRPAWPCLAQKLRDPALRCLAPSSAQERRNRRFDPGHPVEGSHPPTCSIIGSLTSWWCPISEAGWGDRQRVGAPRRGDRSRWALLSRARHRLSVTRYRAPCVCCRHSRRESNHFEVCGATRDLADRCHFCRDQALEFWSAGLAALRQKIANATEVPFCAPRADRAEEIVPVH